mgnify:CR=1 FL=1
MGSEDRETLTISELLSRDGGSVKTGPFGTALKASEYTATGVPLISVREVGYGTFHIDERTPKVSEKTTSRLPEYLLREGDIVFARKGSIDRCAIVTKHQEGWFLGSDGIRLRPPNTVIPKFLLYGFLSPQSKHYQLPAPDFRVGELRTTAVLYAHKDFSEMSKADRIRACYQHCTLMYVTNQLMTNKSLRERFKLPESKTAVVSQTISAAQEAGKIKLDDSDTTSKRYARYLPYWA